MIKLQEMSQNELEQFFRRARKGFYKKGVMVEYHVGNFGDEIGLTEIGSGMRKLYEDGVLDLFQKRIGFEKHQYVGVVR